MLIQLSVRTQYPYVMWLIFDSYHGLAINFVLKSISIEHCTDFMSGDMQIWKLHFLTELNYHLQMQSLLSKIHRSQQFAKKNTNEHQTSN